MSYDKKHLGLIEGEDLTNEEYHGIRGFYSSSQYKVGMKDIETFYKQYILGEDIGMKHIPAFDIGTYYHTGILEPEKLDKECIVYTGDPESKAKLVKRAGKFWEAFKEKHKGMLILNEKEHFQAMNLINATKESPIAMGLLQNGEAELSCFALLEGFPTKVRADWINIQEGYILDLKSTTGNVKDVHAIKKKISDLNYDLSASLYIDTFNTHYGSEVIKDFYWTFASKDMCNCKTYRASKEMLEVGRRKYKFALAQIKKYQEQEWQFYDELEDIDPVSWDKDTWMSEPKKKQEPIKRTVDSDLL